MNSPLTVTLDGTGTINGMPITITGTSVGDPELGVAQADITFSDVPPDFDIAFVDIVIVTWRCKLAAKEVAGGVNMLTLTDGNFGGVRTAVSLDTVGSLVMTATLERTGPTTVEETFTLNGDVTVPVMPDADTLPTFTEFLTPAGLGHMDGHAIVPHVADDGSRLKVDVSTAYEFDSSIELPFAEIQRSKVHYEKTGPNSIHIVYDPVTIQPANVGGATELLVGGSDAPAGATGISDSSAPVYAALAGGIAAAVVSIGAGGWYVRRRRVR